MINIKYANAYFEVLEILKYISVEDYNKIPKNKIELFETNANNDYIFKYDISKTLDEQNVSKITKGIIAILFRDYWATESQREKIISKQNYDRMKIENEKQGKYNTNIFQDKDNLKIEYSGKERKNEIAIVKYKENICIKILRNIKSMFNR